MGAARARIHRSPEWLRPAPPPAASCAGRASQPAAGVCRTALCICPELTRWARSNAEPLDGRLLRDEVDQPVGDEDRALNMPLAQAALYVRAAEGALLGFGLVDPG